MEMFQKPLVVKVDAEGVIFSVRTADERVDEFHLSFEAFATLLETTKVIGKTIRFCVVLSETHKVFFATSLPVFNVMVSEYDAQVGG